MDDRPVGPHGNGSSVHLEPSAGLGVGAGLEAAARSEPLHQVGDHPPAGPDRDGEASRDHVVRVALAQQVENGALVHTASNNAHRPTMSPALRSRMAAGVLSSAVTGTTATSRSTTSMRSGRMAVVRTSPPSSLSHRAYASVAPSLRALSRYTLRMVTFRPSASASSGRLAARPAAGLAPPGIIDNTSTRAPRASSASRPHMASTPMSCSASGSGVRGRWSP